MTPKEREYIKTFLDIVVTSLRFDHVDLTPGEIYDAIAQELERRCRFVAIER